MSGESDNQSNQDLIVVKNDYEDKNEVMKEELGEEDHNNDQGSLSKESDTGSDDKNTNKDCKNILQMGTMYIDLTKSAFSVYQLKCS